MSPWIEAIRLRTLPVSAAGVITATAYGVLNHNVQWVPAMLCLVFALLCQIASNFANEYYDYRDGLDRPGREGPRRGVTEGDISPQAMKRATYLTLAAAALVGLSLVYWGGWWLIAAGIMIFVGALCYSSGPYPLSRHALGEVAVIIFFGLVPVNLTYFLFDNTFDLSVFYGSVAVGLMAANILIVNNYRDKDDDLSVGKLTIANRFGGRTALTLYLLFGYGSIAFLFPLYLSLPSFCSIAPIIYVVIHTFLWFNLLRKKGKALNPMLGLTAGNMLLYAFIFLIESALVGR